MATAKATGDSSTDKQNDLECPICLETFEDPKLLSCGHSICAECVSQMTPPITCPVCRKLTKLPPKDLPSNFILRSLMEKMKEEKCNKHACHECANRYPITEFWSCDGCCTHFVCSTCVVKYHRSHELQTMTAVVNEHDKLLSELRLKMDVDTDFAKGIIFDCGVLNDQIKQLVAATDCGSKALDDIICERFVILSSVNDVDTCQLVVSGQFYNFVFDLEEKLSALKTKEYRLKDDVSLALDMVKKANEVLEHYVPQEPSMFAFFGPSY